MKRSHQQRLARLLGVTAMPFVYHIRHPNFRGTTLYPLNQLKHVYPELYAPRLANYAGRESQMDMIIPQLGVRWNDVVFCSPVPPHRTFLALQQAGAEPDPDLVWFTIPIERLRGRRVVVFKYEKTDLTAPPYRIAEEDIEPFDEESYQELTGLSPRTLQYFLESLDAGRKPLYFRWTTHVLVDGTLDVSGVDTIRWSDPARLSG